MRRALEPFGLSDVSLLVPAGALGVALIVGLAGRPYIGAGITVGAILAFLNSGLLVKRINVAASAPNPGTALIAMQLGLLVTFTVVAIITVLMIQISVEMTVAMALAFLAAQTLELVLVYRARKSRPESTTYDTILTGERV